MKNLIYFIPIVGIIYAVFNKPVFSDFKSEVFGIIHGGSLIVIFFVSLVLFMLYTF